MVHEDEVVLARVLGTDAAHGEVVYLKADAYRVVVVGAYEGPDIVWLLLAHGSEEPLRVRLVLQAPAVEAVEDADGLSGPRSRGDRGCSAGGPPRC